jgi:hypothetical protein
LIPGTVTCSWTPVHGRPAIITDLIRSSSIVQPAVLKTSKKSVAKPHASGFPVKRRHNIHVSKSKAGKVPDTIVDLWVRNLPGPKTAIVSLLGAKPDGTSEFSFYSFCGRESFQDWLDKRHGSLSITVREHPTTDYASIPSAELDAIANDVSRLLAEGYTVVLVDSGGETRTSQVCRHMEFVEDTRSL